MSSLWFRLMATTLALVVMALLIVAVASVGPGFVGGLLVIGAILAAFGALVGIVWIVTNSDDDDDDGGPGSTSGPMPIEPSGGHFVKSASHRSVSASVALLPWFVVAGVAGSTTFVAFSPDTTSATALASAVVYAGIGATILLFFDGVILKRMATPVSSRRDQPAGEERPGQDGKDDDHGAPDPDEGKKPGDSGGQ